MKKSLLASAILASVAVAASGTASAVPIADGKMVFTDGSPTVPADTFTKTSGVYVGGNYIVTGPLNNTQFTTNSIGLASEFRMLGPDGLAGGGGEKSLVGARDDDSTPDNGSRSTMVWQVGEHPLIPGSGIVLGTNGDLTPGAANSALGPVTGALSNAVFFGSFFGFGGNTPISIDVDYGTNKINIDVASIEAQWGDQFFPMGLCDGSGNNEVNTDGQGCGIQFFGDITNVGADGSFDYTLFGEHRITPWEDTEGATLASGAGFAGWTAQFALQGSYSPVPVPAAVWLFGSGLLGLVGVARRKKATV